MIREKREFIDKGTGRTILAFVGEGSIELFGVISLVQHDKHGNIVSQQQQAFSIPVDALELPVDAAGDALEYARIGLEKFDLLAKAAGEEAKAKANREMQRERQKILLAPALPAGLRQ